MTEGTSQGLFVVVAIVIFGIFIGLSYTLFGSEGLSNDLKGIFSNATEQASKKLSNAKMTNILSNEDTRAMLTNHPTTHPVQIESLTSNGDTFQRIKLLPTASSENISLWIPIFSKDIMADTLIGEDVSLSLTYKFENPDLGLKLSARFYDDTNAATWEVKETTDTNGWKTVSLTKKDLQAKELNKDAYFGFVTLIAITDDVYSTYVDIKDVNLSILK